MEDTNSMDNWDEADMNKMVSDGVFYILAQQKKQPIFKRRTVLKSIGIVQKSKILKEVLWRSIIEELNEIFGYKLEESNVKKGEFYLLNSISDPQNNVKLQHLKFTDEEAAKHGLLVIILSIIYMNNEVIKNDTLEAVLEKMKILDSNDVSGRKYRKSIGNSAVDPSMITLFGDVKNQLIHKDWVKRRYIDITKIVSDDFDHPQFEYRWGERAKKEFDKKDILNFVANIYDKPVKAFKDQYQEIGPQNFVQEKDQGKTDDSMEIQ